MKRRLSKELSPGSGGVGRKMGSNKMATLYLWAYNTQLWKLSPLLSPADNEEWHYDEDKNSLINNLQVY